MNSRRSGEGSTGDGKQVSELERVVVLGASAGGLEALRDVLRELDPASGVSLVIAQHLSPDHPSLLGELLDAASALRVVAAEDGADLRAGEAVVIPPHRDATIVGRRLRLAEPPERTSPSPSIDVLLESLAAEWGPRAVAVILSGTGADGAQGLRAVRAAGGFTLVQSPESARFAGMPRAAIEMGGADLVLGPVDIGRRLASMPPEGVGGFGASLREAAPDALTQIIVELQRSTGLDFSGYKESTLRRQVQRRMAVRQLADADAYLEDLRANADEAHSLASNLLVTVTAFFRDPDAFGALRERLAAYLEEQEEGVDLRVWVPGCATGEEAYSLAMVIGDLLGRPSDLRRRLKVFASDLDEASLSLGRRGVFADAQVSHIPQDLRAAYTRPVSGGVQVVESLRECIVFARHDVASDPPFPRIDLISCRNTLIYFTRPMQERALASFEFALKPGGLLFLGAAESLERHRGGFAAVDADHRIYARVVSTLGRGWQPRVQPAGRTTPAIAPVAHREPVADASIEQQVKLLEGLIRLSGEAYLVFDDAHLLVQVVGDVSDYCSVPEGRMPTAGGSFLRRELQDEGRALFLLSRVDMKPLVGQPVFLEDLGCAVRLRAMPLRLDADIFTVLSFLREDDVTPVVSAAERSPAFDRELERLERELLMSQETLRRSLAELQAVNEELEASSEELQASSEELQSSNEELQSSNEELQATNEELGTLNQQLALRSDEQERLNTDLENIQASLSQGMVIVGRDMHIIRFTPLAVRLFALVDTDVGMPLLSVPTTADVPGLADALAAVIGGEERRTIETRSPSMSYLVQVLPYTAANGACLGAIVTLTDVTEIVRLRTEADAALADLQVKSDLLAHQAAYDSLTGLLNRSYFVDSLARAIERADRGNTALALIGIDLDRFKEVNDEYGHEAGDRALQATAARIVDVVRGTDLVGRLGGDEFVVLISGYESLAELESVLDRIVLALRQPIDVGGSESASSGSLGVALYPKDESTPDGLLRAADAAMYSVKREGGNRYSYFDASMNAASEDRRRMRVSIARAIERDEFEMHYQPIVAAATGQVWGMEALVRWRRGETLVPAADFIPFAEESGQIRDLGRTIASHLRRDIPLLRAAAGPPLLVAVNVSVVQLEDHNVDDLQAEWATEEALAGLVFEIVESVFLPDHRLAFDRLGMLAAIGGRIAIDDYGSGYSNMRLLEALKPDFIKLDRSFLGEGRALADRHALVRSAVEVAHVVGCAVIAEGVETRDQWDLVRDAGADLVQGYVVSRPLPLDEVHRWLTLAPEDRIALD